MESVPQILQEELSELLKPYKVCVAVPVVLTNSTHPCGKSANRFVVLSLWRGYLILNKEPVTVESTFSYMEICSISIHSLTQVVLQTDRQSLSLSVLHAEDLETMVSHLVASLKRIFPDSSPGKLLKTTRPDLQQKFHTLSSGIEEQLNRQPGSCGGYSDTYAALCDFNELPIRQEIQWDVDNIYHMNNWRQFNLQDFSHLDNRDLALAVAALSFNQWFTKIYCKDLNLSADVQQQLTFLLSRSPSLEELFLENSGLKIDFAIKMAAALREHTSSTLQSICLSGNQIEDKGVIALSQELRGLAGGLRHLYLSRVSMTARGLGCLGQVLSSTQRFSASLAHLDLSANPSCLGTEDATFLFKFLSSTNCVSHLDLSDTSCPLDTLFVSLSAGCCNKLFHLNLARNPFSHRKVQEVTRSIREFFSQCCELKYVDLSATKLPPQALRLLLQGLATNTHICGLELDISSCELHSAGAQVIQEHIAEATTIRSLDISNNGFENDMVTLVLSVGRCHSLRHLALGRNFAMKSRALTDVLQRIAQLIQDEECSLQSLSVCDSKLKAGASILLSALGGPAALAHLDISGNAVGDTGAKMLAKALMNNTNLRSLAWDRNNVTAKGFQDVADALERNLTLQQVSLPLTDVTQSYRSNPDRTKEALRKIQQCLDRNNQRESDRVKLQQVSIAQKSEELLQGLSAQLEASLQRVDQGDVQELHADIRTALEVIHSSREALKELAHGLMRCGEAACPRVVQCSGVCECLSDCVSKRSGLAHTFRRGTPAENTGQIISGSRLRGLRKTHSVAGSIKEQLQDLTMAQDKTDCLTNKNSSITLNADIPEVRLSDCNFPTDDYSPAFWRNSFRPQSLRPASTNKSLAAAERECGPSPSRDAAAAVVLSAQPVSLLLLQHPVLSSAPAPALAPYPAPSSPAQAQAPAVFPRPKAAFPGRGRPPPPLPGMEPLPTQGQTLRHYTASRPRPRRAHTQPPSFRPQEAVSKAEHEASEGMGRVDEGVEEFFTKKIIPDYALKGRWEESNPAQGTPSETSSTPPASTPLSPLSDTTTTTTTTTTPITPASVPYTDTSVTSTDVPPLPSSVTTHPPASATAAALPGKNIKKKFGDFFAFKRARAGRASKAGGGEGGGGEGAKVKRTSIADLIRPLREREREREKGRGDRSVEDAANVSHDAAATTEGTAATGRRLAGDTGGTAFSAGTPASDTPPSSHPHAVSAPNPGSTAALTESGEEEEAEGPPASAEQQQQQSGDAALMEGMMKLGDRRPLKVTKRSLREGKSQSLILLTGSEPEHKDDTHCKKHASENTCTFEQRLQVMFHRMGVVKPTPADSQNKDEELRKANSEGTILDRPKPPPTYLKPRTMSTSSADPRHPVRVLDPVRPLHPKPTFPERPIGALPPKPAVAAKPTLPSAARPSSAPPSSSPTHTVQQRTPHHDWMPAQNGSREGPQGAATARSPPAPCPWRGASDRTQSVTDESFPQLRPHTKPLPQRRAVSVHEDALTMTQELKAVLQRSPIRFRGIRGDLSTCTEHPDSWDKALRTRERVSDTGEQSAEKKMEDGKAERARTVAETNQPCPASGCPSLSAQPQQETALFSTAAALCKAPSTLDTSPALTRTLEKPSVTPPTLQKKSPGTARAFPQSIAKTPASGPTREKTHSTTTAAPKSESPDDPTSLVSRTEKIDGKVLTASVDQRKSTQHREHTTKAQPADQRIEPPLSE